MDRFTTQINLKDFGPKAQLRLQQSSVLVVGAGGLGCPALLYLAAAGTGKIGIADGDVVNLSNLNRQTLYAEKDTGRLKASVAARALQHKYPDITIEVFTKFINKGNAARLLSGYNLILDCTDNLKTRYIINDCCIALKKPFVYAAIYEYEGQISFFNKPDAPNPYNYRDLFPVPPPTNQAPDCSATGVLGVLPGIIGTLQAAEAIKYLSGTGTLLSGQLLYFNVKTMAFQKLTLRHNPNSVEEALVNFPRNQNPAHKNPLVINQNDALSILSQDPARTLFIDVREKQSSEIVPGIPNVHIPIGSLSDEQSQFEGKENLIIYCHSGILSAIGSEILSEAFPDKNIYTLKSKLKTKQLGTDDTQIPA